MALIAKYQTQKKRENDINQSILVMMIELQE